MRRRGKLADVFNDGSKRNTSPCKYFSDFEAFALPFTNYIKHKDA